jgi:hypothetical protein
VLQLVVTLHAGDRRCPGQWKQATPRSENAGGAELCALRPQ